MSEEQEPKRWNRVRREKSKENRRKWRYRQRLAYLIRRAKGIRSPWDPPKPKPKKPPRWDPERCTKGHPWAEYAYIIPSGPKAGYRQCRECKRLREAARKARKREAVKAQLKAEAQERRAWRLRRPPAKGVSE